ncbi:hypothetical protein D3C86_1920350 [compost metagenome]
MKLRGFQQLSLSSPCFTARLVMPYSLMAANISGKMLMTSTCMLFMSGPQKSTSHSTRISPASRSIDNTHCSV